MRVLLRLLAPLLGLALAAAGVLLVIEVVAAWVRPDATTGLLVPWPQGRTALAELTWRDGPVPLIAIGVGILGLLLVLVGTRARRHDIVLEPPAPGITLTTTPRVLARLVGRRVRAHDDIAAASVTASARRVKVVGEGWGVPGPALRGTVTREVEGLLDELPLARRPRVAVAVRGRKGPR